MPSKRPFGTAFGQPCAVILGGLGIEGEPIYTIPLTSDYSILLDGQTLTNPATTSLTQFGPGYALSVEDIEVGEATQDLIYLATDGTQPSYQASEDKESTFTLALEGTSESDSFEVQGADLTAEKSIELTADYSTGNLVFDNSQSDNGVYDFRMEQINLDGKQEFFHPGIPILESSTQYLDFGNWDGGFLAIGVDFQSDGIVDEVITYENFANRVYLPISIR